MATEGYENVPGDVKESNRAKLESLQKKKPELQQAIGELEKLSALEGGSSIVSSRQRSALAWPVGLDKLATS